MKKIDFVIDGFNVYHSIRDYEKQSGQKLRWLDLKELLRSKLYLLGKDWVMGDAYYFSAFASFLLPKDPHIVIKHQTYIEALRTTGVVDIISRFKVKNAFCKNCGKIFQSPEEKETDVAIASKIIELGINKKCDAIGVVTGDTDIIPSIKTVKKLNPLLKVVSFFPHGRKNDYYNQVSDNTFKLNGKSYGKYLFPDQIINQDGSVINKPFSW